MRSLNTTRFGVLAYDEQDIIRFPKGIPGFYDMTEWVIAGEDESPVKWLQSLQDGDVALPVAPPEIVDASYNAKLAEADLEELEKDRVESMALVVVVTIPPEAPWNMTANLRAPIVINHEKRIGKQVVALNEEYSMRTYILSEAMRDAMAAQAASGEKVTASAEES